jgi:hypothetical protein
VYGNEIYYYTPGEIAMETYIVTIPITTDMDSAQLLDIVNTQISQMVSDEIESYGYEVEVDENEIAVENVDD